PMAHQELLPRYPLHALGSRLDAMSLRYWLSSYVLLHVLHLPGRLESLDIPSFGFLWRNGLQARQCLPRYAVVPALGMPCHHIFGRSTCDAKPTALPVYRWSRLVPES